MPARRLLGAVPTAGGREPVAWLLAIARVDEELPWASPCTVAAHSLVTGSEFAWKILVFRFASSESTLALPCSPGRALRSNSAGFASDRRCTPERLRRGLKLEIVGRGKVLRLVRPEEHRPQVGLRRTPLDRAHEHVLHQHLR